MIYFSKIYRSGPHGQGGAVIGTLNFATLLNMKKTCLFAVLFICALAAQAQSAHVGASYVYSPDFNQVRAGGTVPLGLNAAIGIEGKYVDDKLSAEEGGFKDPVYSVYLPMQLDLDLVKLNLTPFYYFKHKSELEAFDDPYAFGATLQMVMNLQIDEVEDLYTQAYLQAGYAKQKGVLQKDGVSSDENYSQLAYTLGLRQNFFGAFTFHAAATAYQYPDGISDVQNFRGIFDQNDLAFTQSYDVSRALGKYALSARITRIWVEKRSTLYLGYHFAEFYTADSQHSFLAGNSFYVAPAARVDAAYNHLQNTGGNNKRDIFYINLNIAF